MDAARARPLTITVIVPVHNGSRFLRRCLEAVVASDYPDYECIVVDDSSTDGSREVAAEFPVRLLALDGGARGPAYARNAGARVAAGRVLFFVDADVVIHRDVLGRVARAFQTHPDIDAVFGSYDDAPEDLDFVSQYKNLTHHFVHQEGREEASTFWSGCGAVRREVFLEMGGFDYRRYPRPCIEDIDLGCRLRAAGHRILLDKGMEATHLKRWTLRGMIMSDVFDRAIPWTLLILGNRELPSDLNLRASQRISALLVCVMLLHLGLTSFFHNVVMLPLLAGLFLMAVGYWHWPEKVPPFRTSLRAELATYLLLGAITAVAIISNKVWILPPLTPILLGLMAGRWMPRANLLWTRWYFAVLLIGLITSFGIVLYSFRVWLALPLLLLVCAIVLLNHRFYRFCARKRGIMFALGAIPFQLLYYLYSALAFAMALFLHAANRRTAQPPLYRADGGTTLYPLE